MKKVKITILTIMISVVVFSCVPINFTYAQSDNKNAVCVYSTDFASVTNSSTFNVDLSLTSDFTELVAAFSMDIYLPSDGIDFSGITNYQGLSSSELQYYQSGNKITVLYLSEYDGFLLESGKTQNILSLNFKSEDNSLGDYNIRINTYGVVTNDLNMVNLSNADESIPIHVDEYEPVDCRLQSLEPSTGQLEPTFNSDNNIYNLDVPSQVSEVTFTAVPINADNVVKVSRKTLYKAGTQTQITISVKANTGETEEYVVNVNRASSDDTTKSTTTTSKNTSSSKPTSSSSSSSSKSDGKSSSSGDDSNLSLARNAINSNGNHFWIYMIVLIVAVSGAIVIVLWKNKKNNSDVDNGEKDDVEDENNK